VRLLLDTHTFFWRVLGDPALPNSAQRQIAQSQEAIIVNAVSAWEIAIKVSLGRLPSAADLVRDFEASLGLDGFLGLAISSQHALRAGLLPGPPKDPFDRMLIAQAQAENLAIVSNDKIFDQYGLRRFW
jgi:PIN domain nuclease of toxin-antitoxin system